MTDEGNFEGKNILFIDTNFTASSQIKSTIESLGILPEEWRENVFYVNFKTRAIPLVSHCIREVRFEANSTIKISGLRL